MSTFDIPMNVAQVTDHPVVKAKVEKESGRYGSDEIGLYQSEMTDDLLTAVMEAALEQEEKPLARVIDAIIKARSGDFKTPIPRLTAAPEIILAYLNTHKIDGWLYLTEGRSGHYRPWLVTDVEYVEARSADDRPSVTISLRANGLGTGNGRRGASGMTTLSKTLSFSGSEVAKKRVETILEEAGALVETEGLREQYDTDMAHFQTVLREGFSEQYIFSGHAATVDWDYDDDGNRKGAKVIHDVHRSEIGVAGEWHDSVLHGTVEVGATHTRKKKGVNTEKGDGLGPLPTHDHIRIFDLGSHKYLWASTRNLTRYKYDPSLREKIILPEDQRNLLDILTTDIGDFTGDIIDGKSTGNVVLCLGRPGVGKTLTAEVYSELIERPLYSIHSGTLGITADSVRKNLEQIFEQVNRWKCVLLLDEADVFVRERGMNLTQNAIVAEFLRTMEYFDGLMFMTSNLAESIDDAILSRAAAIIDYKVPSAEAIRHIWEVQAANQKTEIPEDVLDGLVGGFEEITGRDVKMLLRLALKVSRKREVPLTIDLFAQCAMFRGLHLKPGSREV